ncbi:MAG: hypothetical protein AABW83_03895 [Nanoarchaeota archaeon]
MNLYLKKDMNKRGQFYLIASIFIVLIIFGTSSIATYTIIKPEPRTITDLSNDINRESYKIIEYGIFNNKNLNELSSKFAGEEISKYVLKKDEDANILFLYGNKNDINAIAIGKEDTGNIEIGEFNFQVNNDFSRKIKPIIKNDLVEVKISGKKYNFKIKDNEMFYFLMVKEKDGEIFVERNEEDKNTKKPGKLANDK